MWHLLLVCIRNYTRGWTLHAARVMHFSVHNEDIRRQQASEGRHTGGWKHWGRHGSGQVARSDTMADVKVHGRWFTSRIPSEMVHRTTVRKYKHKNSELLNVSRV